MIDLRSDTVTRPTAAMREAMAAAPVGDDVYGDDPSVNALEARVAEMTGMEAALLLPTGTQSNLVALLAHCERGDEYIVGQSYHTYRYEGGGAAVLGSIQPQPIPVQDDGSLALEDIEAYIKPDDLHVARSRLLALENTCNGRVLSVDYVHSAAALARRHGLNVHMDGARLFNAVVAAGVTLQDYTGAMDSVSLCFSKGLGAPVGSMLAGSQALIHAARRWRKMTGGGMRQAGILAAAIDHALTHHVADLAHDHRRAAMLAEGLSALNRVEAVTVNTNMIYMTLPDEQSGGALQAHLAEQGVLISGGRRIRLVMHRDIDDDDVQRVLDLIGTGLAA
ncbi:low-specificity L-threonine aldolase [Natronospirillum operosum]|uniref:Low-specificity L-threonine aldolase n=1 Tax=Natronospirillum operosum TaxID=2759953 RepID=A0A4Z0WE01_9GAMM|nr:low-specificity L-threonine aldolase [Natronospirillum operosum]TGG96064.1 low-specificity L-threonine aldolase [Natronospirillum operosum]